MNHGLKKKREINPRENASIFSIIFFTYTSSIFYNSLKKELQEDDIYEVLNSCRANELGDKLEKAWEEEKCKTKPWIFRSLFKVFGWEWVACGLVDCVCTTSLLLLRPVLIGRVVSYFSKGQTQVSKETAYIYTALLIGAIAAYTLYLHTFMLCISQLALKVRVACSSLIYRKTLKLSSSSLKIMTCGRVVTLLTKDVNSFDFSVYSSHSLWIGMVRTILTTYVMYREIGVSALVGVAVLILLIPLHVILGKSLIKFRLKTAKETDKRVRITQEILTAIRIIKMYTWERFFTKEVNLIRKQEITNLRIVFYIKACVLSLGGFSMRIAIYACLITYLMLGHNLTAEKTFVVVGCFNALRMLLTVMLPTGVSQVGEALASLKRITDFLNCTEVAENRPAESTSSSSKTLIVLQNVSSRYDLQSHVFTDLSFEINTGLTAITGSVGCGKSTLLKLILKDIPVSGGSVMTHGVVSYASQQPWLFPSSVKQNIVFGEPLDESRYKKVIKVCALRKDLDSFPFGDLTHVTDKGLNLSSGQKSRINLARAVYKNADIYLLDDCLSAVDAHVGKYIFEECFQSFLKDKLCVVVIHGTQFLKEFNDIILLNKGGVQYRGTFENNIEWNSNNNTKTIDSKPADNVEVTDTNNENLVSEEEDNTDELSNLLNNNKNEVLQKSVYQEIKQEGVVSRKVYKEYAMHGGGLSMVLFVAGLFILSQSSTSLFDYIISYWTDIEETLSEQRTNGLTNSTTYAEAKSSQTTALQLFTVSLLGSIVLLLASSIAFFLFCTRASANVHTAILDKIMNSTISFFDTNMSGNVLNRFSRDLGIIDDILPNVGYETTRMLLTIFSVIFLVSFVNAILLIPSLCLVLVLIQARKFYLRTGRTLKRLAGTTKSPVIGHLNASMEGLTTIRASKAQNVLKNEFDKYLDTSNSAAYMEISTDRAFGFFLDSIGTLYVFVIILSFFMFITDTGGNVGLAIVQSFSMTLSLQYGARQWAEIESQMTSVERALEYTKIKQEDTSGDKPEKWPSHGKIEYKEVNLRYPKSNETVLKGVSFTIEPQQKVGIVGRTGAGKSSIISVLFKLYEIEGSICIDDVDINTIDMDLLRSSIAIIPQDPVFFTDTLRNNLDPTNTCTDKELWDALEEVEMKSTVACTDSGLDCNVSEGGSNFSIGQRQLLCLTRAIIRKNNILVLDEATANIDPQTDAVIQRAIRKNFSDCTVITVAHKLHTILDSDKVLVMDSGRVVEYDEPKELLKDESGVFYGMVRQAGLLKLVRTN